MKLARATPIPCARILSTVSRPSFTALSPTGLSRHAPWVDCAKSAKPYADQLAPVQTSSQHRDYSCPSLRYSKNVGPSTTDRSPPVPAYHPPKTRVVSDGCRGESARASLAKPAMSQPCRSPINDVSAHPLRVLEINGCAEAVLL